MSDEQLFAFESDFVASLRCIPMAVRMKLDRVAIKLTLRQWSRFTLDDRQQLLRTPCRTHREIGDYRRLLVELVACRAGEVAGALTNPPEPLWEQSDSVPEIVAIHARSIKASPPAPAQWSGLTELQRFALLKLTRDNHDNVNFVPAMREFGII
ncbi:nitrate reductase associated protein [Caulobacter segnis]|uniref:nitrate reductase associated protein n=1 Tax=Caulobacter segnis TaxID=88688 RepID=UPI00240FFBD1|nr:nitrate reductase associated protein [Caulobacter segnis]MDG2522152.1 nitrate reductase associated protein [Caulobacter segnis]